MNQVCKQCGKTVSDASARMSEVLAQWDTLYCHPDPQCLYDKGWQAFHKWATDSSNKACSDANLGREFGDELRRIASTPLGAAALKAAFAEGWRSTGPLRHEAAYRLFANADRDKSAKAEETKP